MKAENVTQKGGRQLFHVEQVAGRPFFSLD